MAMVAAGEDLGGVCNDHKKLRHREHKVHLRRRCSKEAKWVRLGHRGQQECHLNSLEKEGIERGEHADDDDD